MKTAAHESQQGRPEGIPTPEPPLDIREAGAVRNGTPQTADRRIYCQLHVYRGCGDTGPLMKALAESGLDAVLYQDWSDPTGVGLFLMVEDPAVFAGRAAQMLAGEPFTGLFHEPRFTMAGRTYSTGREADLEDWLLRRPLRYALNPDWSWAIWYPLRRKPEFALLPKAEQGKILMEHAMLGKNFAEAGFAYDIRLACYGLDTNDNEFVLGLLGPELYPLSRLVQEMRKTEQTARYIQSLGPFFVGKVIWRNQLAQT